MYTYLYIYIYDYLVYGFNRCRMYLNEIPLFFVNVHLYIYIYVLGFPNPESCSGNCPFKGRGLKP